METDSNTTKAFNVITSRFVDKVNGLTTQCHYIKFKLPPSHQLAAYFFEANNNSAVNIK